MPIPLIVPVLAAGGIALWAALSGKSSGSPSPTPSPSPSPSPTPRNRTGELDLPDPAKQAAAEVAQAAAQAAKVVQGLKPGQELMQAALELEAHLKATRPGQERPAMVAAFQSLRGGLAVDGKYGPQTALAEARTLGRTPPPPRVGTAMALAKYKSDLAALMGSARSVSAALAPQVGSGNARTIPFVVEPFPRSVTLDPDPSTTIPPAPGRVS